MPIQPSTRGHIPLEAALSSSNIFFLFFSALLQLEYLWVMHQKNDKKLWSASWWHDFCPLNIR